MVSLLGLYGGVRGRIHAKRGGGAGGTGSSAWRAPAPVRHLFWRVRSSLRNGVLLRPARRRAVSFGYDLRSYCQNFDDGLVSDHRF